MTKIFITELMKTLETRSEIACYFHLLWGTGLCNRLKCRRWLAALEKVGEVEGYGGG